MTAALALALFARQGSPATLPMGTSVAFAQAALAVEAKLAAGDVPGAREAATALPARNPRIIWRDEETLPPKLRAARAAGFAKVVEIWARRAKGFAPRETGEGSDLTIGFAKSLPEGADGLPVPSTVQLGPPFQATIGLTRGNPGQPLRVEELNMEMAYAVGRYLGVNDMPFPGSAMYRDSRPNLLTFMPQTNDLEIASRNLDLADRLRAAVDSGKPIGLTVPNLHLPKPRLDLEEVRQGEKIHTEILIENPGNGSLQYLIKPDCGCFHLSPSGMIKGTERIRVMVTIDTDAYVGRQEKRLLLLTNDPKRPSLEIPVTFSTRPAYRLLHPGGDSVVVPAGGGTYDVFLFSNPASPIRPKTARWEGSRGTLTWAAWAGPLADPEMQEGALPRQGWRFRIRVPANGPAGRIPGTLIIETDSIEFGSISYTLNTQRGIVALPESVYLGDVQAGSGASLLISRPNAPFKILGIDAGPLKGSWHDIRGGWEYRVDLVYQGGMQVGDFLLPVKIRTDDPKQPVIEALASGNVK